MHGNKNKTVYKPPNPANLMAMNGMIPKKMDDKGKSKIAKLMELLKNGDLILDEYDKKMKKMKCIEEG